MGTLLHYKDLIEKENSFERVLVKTKSDFTDLFDSILKGGSDSIWRGLSESKFKHYTSLQRFWIQNDLEKTNEEVEKFLKHIFNYSKQWNSDFFRKYFENYGPVYFPIISALSILRHHGTPTPMLDWSRNPLVALFFGVSSADSYQSSNEIDNYFSLYEMKSSHPYYSHDLKDKTFKFFKTQEVQLREANKSHKDDPKFLDNYVQGYLNQEDFFFKNIKRYPISIIQDLPGDK